MSGLWSDWPHTAISIESQSTDWSYTFSAGDITGGAVTGAASGLDPVQDLNLIRAGLRIVPRLAVTVFNAGYAVSVVIGDGRRNYTLAPVNTTDTEFHIHQFQGQWYFLRGAGSITADDGQTSLSGGTLIHKQASNYSGPMRLLAGFVTASDSIEGYSWDTLSSLGTVDPSGGAVANTGQATNTMGLLTEGRATAFGLGTGVFGNPEGDPGGGTIDGVTTPVDIEDTGDDGTGTTFTYDDVTDDWTSEPITTVEIVDGDVGGGVITLPTTPDPDDTIVVVGINGGGTVDGDTETINGLDDPYTIDEGEVVEFVYDGGTWVPVVVDDAVVIDTTGGDVDYTLPPNPADGETVTIIVIGGGIVTVGLAELGLAASASAIASLGLTALALEGYELTEVNYAYQPMSLDHAASGVDFSARGTATLAIGARGSENSFNGAFMTMPMTSLASGDTFPYVAPYFDSVFLGTFSSYPYPRGAYDVTELLEVAAPVHVNYANIVREVIQALSGVQTFWQTSSLVAESIVVAAAAEVRVSLGLGESLSAGDEMLSSFAVRLVEAIQSAAGTETAYQAIAAISEQLQAEDILRWAGVAKVPEELQTADGIAELLKRVALVIDALNVDDAIGNAFTVGVNESVGMEIADGVDVLGHYLTNVSEHPNIWVGFKLGDEAFTGWVMNTEGDMPISEYTDYPFNSFCELGGEYYGAGEDGLYRLAGSDDAGENINASVLTMMTDFNSTKMKRVPTAYVGYTADGKMVLRVRAVSGGELREHWFSATYRTADAPREQVIQLGRGIRSRYWQFELANIDGADFEIDKLELYPVYLNRRV